MVLNDPFPCNWTSEVRPPLGIPMARSNCEVAQYQLSLWWFQVEMFAVTASENGYESERLLEEFLQTQRELFRGLDLHFRWSTLPTVYIDSSLCHKSELSWHFLCVPLSLEQIVRFAVHPNMNHVIGEQIITTWQNPVWRPSHCWDQFISIALFRCKLTAIQRQSHRAIEPLYSDCKKQLTGNVQC